MLCWNGDAPHVVNTIRGKWWLWCPVSAKEMAMTLLDHTFTHRAMWVPRFIVDLAVFFLQAIDDPQKKCKEDVYSFWKNLWIYDRLIFFRVQVDVTRVKWPFCLKISLQGGPRKASYKWGPPWVLQVGWNNLTPSLFSAIHTHTIHVWYIHLHLLQKL